MGDGSGDSIYLDIYWCYLDQGSIKINCTNNDYFDHVDEDDYGTFFTLCPIDIDNDTTYMKYTGKTVGWSNPVVHSVMLSAPYWSELDYGSTMTSRGSTSYSISTSSTNSITGNWNFGLGFSFLFSTEVKAGAGIFQQQSFGYGFNIDIGAQYAGSYQTSNTRSETLTFTSGGGEDYVALLVVPIAVYHYDQWIPTHKATEEEVKDYKLLYGEEGCPKVGDIIEGTFKNMDVNIQLNPANSCIPVSTYNSVIEEFNRTENDEHYKLKTVDVDSLYAGRNPGDPSTYASEANQISSLNVEDKESYMVSNNSAVIGINGNSTTSIAMGKGSSSSLSNGFSLSLKTTSTLGIQSKEGCLVYLVASIKISATSTFGGGCTWANANSENITYTTTFAPLPESARTSTTSSGTKSSAYEFTAREVKWNPKELGSSNIQTVDGEELTNATCVIGCLVQGADAAPPKLPRDLHVSSTTSNSETLRWSNTTNYERKPESYKLYYSTSSNGDFVALKNNGKDVIISGDSEICTVNGLKENTTYYFRLQAYSTKDASGSPSVLGPYASGKTKNSKDSQNEPIIIKYPVDLYKNIGEKPIFTIEAKPSNPENTISYKWQKLVVGNYIADWKDIDQEFGKSSSFNAAYFADNGVINEANAKSLDETVYRCIVTEYSNTDHNYYTNISRAAVLYIEKEHQHIYNNNGFCDFCGKYQPAVLNGNGFYEIRNAGQLFWFAALINGDKSNADFEAQQKGANAILLNDIDLEEREWTPIGNYETGIFDGNNYTISNLRISKNSSGKAISSQGFFGSVTGGTIKNFTILGEVKTTDYNVGGIAGSTSKDTILSNIIANVDVTGNEKVGGIVGNNSGIITNCYNNGNVTGVVELTGGITGFNDGSIIKCNNTGDVSSSYDFIGGIAGYNSGNIKLCSNSGNIKSSGSYIGGIAGENLTKYMDALISNCYNTGDITSSYDEDGYLGGIVGYNSYAFVESCYNVGKIQGGKSYSNALIGYNNEYDPKINTRVKNCYYLYTYDVGDSLGISRTESEFNSGEVAYLLNKGVTEGDQVWYQNIDNGKTPDLYPVLDNNSGTVYFPSEAYYSNFDKLLEEFDRNENGSFIIRTYDDLVKLANLVDNNYSQYGKENYILENNIIVPSDFEWTKGIGSADDNKPFNGTFDGNGYIIFGLNVKNSKYGGLFERIGPKGIVKNLFVIDCDYNTASEYAGGIVAINDGLVDHCVSGIALTTGSTFDKNGQPIKLSDYNSDIKGVISGGVAAVNNGTIKACRNASFVNGTDVCGGITGINNEEGSIYGCASNIIIGNSSSKLKGGLVGKNFGSIASSYTSAKISNATEENAGSIAGLNASENVKNVFYYTTNNIKVVGSNSTVIPDDTNKNKLKSEMLTKEFVDELNSVTDDSVEWIYNANTKLNNNYPTIKCDFYKQLIKKTSDGISVKGLMHRSLKVNSQAFDTNSESYKKLLSYAGNRTIVSSYNLTLTDSNENYIPSNLWYLSGVEISVPVNSSNELSVVGITDDGEIKEFEVLSMNNGKLTFKSDDIVSFALLSSNTPNQPDDSSKDNSINNSVVNTGDYNYSFAYILIISAIAVIVLSVLRRKKLEKD
ncbi:GLUG motif-containing protein [Pseudoruminococcus massiliensis]|uniref:GLUG motif-containing protein n=1 Tax=Pseudoruminococcus massiliensis TaxID=2086583 RepID=UPI003FD7FF14